MRTHTAVFTALLLFLCGMVGGVASAQEFNTREMEMIVVHGERIPPDGMPNLSPDEVRERMATALKLLEEQKLPVYTVEERNGLRSLRGRPVMYAAQSARDQSWHFITVEMPIPAKDWRPNVPYTDFKVITPGYTAEHLRGKGDNILMFRFFMGDERLYVYGRKYPDLDPGLYYRKKMNKTRYESLLARTTFKYNVPYTPDVHYPEFETVGLQTLERTSCDAVEDLRTRGVPSRAFPGRLLSDTIPCKSLVVLALIEQMDDGVFAPDRLRAMNEILNQYGLYGNEAYMYSVSSAHAQGSMQFTDNEVRKRRRVRGKWVTVVYDGTYTMVRKLCPTAGLMDDFMVGSRDMANAMKAALCLLDYELSNSNMQAVRDVYFNNEEVLDIFRISAYNGGPDDPKRLLAWILKNHIPLTALRSSQDASGPMPDSCPCLRVADPQGTVRLISLPKPSWRGFNRENLWYIEKYLFVLRALDAR